MDLPELSATQVLSCSLPNNFAGSLQFYSQLGLRLCRLLGPGLQPVEASMTLDEGGHLLHFEGGLFQQHKYSLYLYGGYGIHAT